MAVICVFLYILYNMFIGGIRAFRREEGKTQSMAASILGYEIIAKDLLENLYFCVPHDQIDATPPVVVSEPAEDEWGRQMSFRAMNRLDYDAAVRPTLEHRLVTFSLVDSGNPKYKLLKRTEQPGDEQVFGSVKLVDAQFRLEKDEQYGEFGKPIYFVSLKLMGYGEQDRDTNVIMGLVSLDSCSLRNINRYWVEEPTVYEGYPP